MKIEYVVIVDKAAGNDVVGEMWQETRIFSSTTTLQEVMEWALSGEYGDKEYPSKRKVTITRPDTRGQNDED